MERLTARNYGGIPITNEECYSHIIERLAAYEDTGLSPADIADLLNEHCLLCGKYKTAHLGSCDGCRWKEK